MADPRAPSPPSSPTHDDLSMDDASSGSEAEFDFDEAEKAATATRLTSADDEDMDVDAEAERDNEWDEIAPDLDSVQCAVLTGIPSPHSPAASRHVEASQPTDLSSRPTPPRSIGGAVTSPKGNGVATKAPPQAFVASAASETAAAGEHGKSAPPRSVSSPAAAPAEDAPDPLVSTALGSDWAPHQKCTMFILS